MSKHAPHKEHHQNSTERNTADALTDDQLDAISGGNRVLDAFNPVGPICKAVETVYDVGTFFAGGGKK